MQLDRAVLCLIDPDQLLRILAGQHYESALRFLQPGTEIEFGIFGSDDITSVCICNPYPEGEQDAFGREGAVIVYDPKFVFYGRRFCLVGYNDRTRFLVKGRSNRRHWNAEHERHTVEGWRTHRFEYEPIQFRVLRDLILAE